ncbi:MAG: EAL domain-containing protein [Sandaracinaceae bacterium]
MSSNPELLPFLDHHPDAGGRGHRIHLRTFPFRLGRSDAADHTIYAREVSGLHAQIERRGHRYLVKDLRSKNGTFVNGKRVEGVRELEDGDILHVASTEFRFGTQEVRFDEEEHTVAAEIGDQQRLIRDSNNLERLLSTSAVEAFHQPIVSLKSAGVVGFEMLGRPTLAEATYSIGELFRVAVERGKGSRLSRLLRVSALDVVPHLPGEQCLLFFNIHPTEMSDDELIPSLEAIPEALRPGQRAVVEIHEAAMTDPVRMGELRRCLDDLDIGLAYDDFGAGQSRLMELIEVPPDYLKLDMALVRHIHLNARRQELVSALVEVMTGIGIVVLAEGIEHLEEAATCASLGCTLGQGYFYGRPTRLITPTQPPTT